MRRFQSVEETFRYLWGDPQPGLCGALHRYDPNIIYCAACLDVKFDELQVWAKNQPEENHSPDE